MIMMAALPTSPHTCMHTLKIVLHACMHPNSYAESCPPAGEARDGVSCMIEHMSSRGPLDKAQPPNECESRLEYWVRPASKLNDVFLMTALQSQYACGESPVAAGAECERIGIPVTSHLQQALPRNNSE